MIEGADPRRVHYSASENELETISNPQNFDAINYAGSIMARQIHVYASDRRKTHKLSTSRATY